MNEVPDNFVLLDHKVITKGDFDNLVDYLYIITDYAVEITPYNKKSLITEHLLEIEKMFKTLKDIKQRVILHFDEKQMRSSKLIPSKKVFLEDIDIAFNCLEDAKKEILKRKEEFKNNKIGKIKFEIPYFHPMYMKIPMIKAE